MSNGYARAINIKVIGIRDCHDVLIAGSRAVSTDRYISGNLVRIMHHGLVVGWKNLLVGW